MSQSAYSSDTIAAVATAPGRGGVGIVRVSGPKSLEFAEKILRFTPKPRHAHYSDFVFANGEVLDQGIALYFPGPNSFTGEDVVEFQGHGGPIILDMLLTELTQLGARLANPGEFSERAFLNDKLDLAQAEAIADLIEASSHQAAKQALNSLKGEFSQRVDTLVESIIHLRMYVESAIDFPEEEIDFLSDGKVASMLDDVIQNTNAVMHQAKQGVLMKEGMTVVIAGRPNAGKSSLLNRLVDQELAIVTDIAGTTRDVLREHIHIDGLPLHIVDTAGIREGADEVERIGIERAWQEIDKADRILLMVDANEDTANDAEQLWPEFFQQQNYRQKLSVIFNKLDTSQSSAEQLLKTLPSDIHALAISAKTGSGIDELKQALKQFMGFESSLEGGFSARRRHLTAIERAQNYLHHGKTQLEDFAAGELLAEDLRLAQDHLNEITGAFTADDLLGKIFGSFCIGK